MPYFVFIGRDRAESAALREEKRPAHRAYIRVAQAGCTVVAGGPLVGDDGQPMTGTLLVLKAEDRAAALRFLAGDPYAQARLFESTALTRWAWGLGNPPEES
ncbi:MAG: YciI family protein [Azospirillaceae bacterium]|nr:YciI family protein [Azospirillaceae bacterium]